MGSWMEAGHRKDQAMVRALGLSVPSPPPSSGKGSGAGDCINNKSCLHDEASIKIPELQAWRT